jgi:hypothetical protein
LATISRAIGAIKVRRRNIFPQRLGILSEATETMERRTKVSPGNLATNFKTTGTKAVRSERRSSQSTFGGSPSTEAVVMKVWETQLSVETTSPATQATATKKKTRMTLSPVNATITSPDMVTKITEGKRRRRRRGRGRTRSLLSIDTRCTATEVTGRKRMSKAQMDTTIMSLTTRTKVTETRKVKMRIYPLSTGTRSPDMFTMALGMRKRTRRRSQSSSAIMLQAPNPKAIRVMKRRTSQMSIKQKPLTITTIEPPGRKTKTYLMSLATRPPATGNKTTKMSSLAMAAEGPFKKRLAIGPQVTQRLGREII